MKKQVSLVLISLLVSSMLRGSSVSSGGGGGLTSPVGISDGGTGQTSAQGAIDALLPSQGSANGKYLTSNGSASSWGSITAVSGPGSSVDGEIATWNGTGGNTLRSEAKMTVNASTGVVTHTFAGAPTQLITEDLSTATNWGSGRVMSGTIASASSSIYPEDFSFTHTLSGSKQITGRYFRPTLSGSTSARAVGELQDLTATVSGNSWGGHQVSVAGVFGHNIRTYNASTSGASGAYVGTTQANYSLALSGVGIASIGTNGKSGGVSGAGSTSNSPTIAYGGYFRLDAAYDAGTETEVWPNASAALVANTGDVAATIPAFIAQNNGSSVFQVQNNGRTVIGANGGTARHELNTATQATGAATATLTNSPVAGNPTMYIRLMVNGTEVFIPAWRTP